MAEIILSVIIVVLLADRGWTTRQWAKERRQLLDAVIARTPQELTVLRAQESPQPLHVNPEDVLSPYGL